MHSDRFMDSQPPPDERDVPRRSLLHLGVASVVGIVFGSPWAQAVAAPEEGLLISRLRVRLPHGSPTYKTPTKVCSGNCSTRVSKTGSWGNGSDLNTVLISATPARANVALQEPPTTRPGPC